MPFLNRVRLPIRTKWPQFPEEREVFRKADGTTKVVMVQVRKTYTLETGHMPERLHERLKIALAHDTVNIENTHLLSGISQDGGYQIEWPDFKDFPLGKANATIQVTPFNATNTNCMTCEEFAQVTAEDDYFENPPYQEGLQEDGEYNLDVAANDNACCYPATWSLISYNAEYLVSADMTPAGLFIIVVGNGLVAGNNILLGTYRVTCPNGDYDEANIYASIDGSEEGCFGPENLEVINITSSGATVIFDDPANPPVTYELFVYLATDLVTVIYAASAASGGTPNTYIIPGLDPDTDYVVIVIGNCAEGDSSPVQAEFTTLEEMDTCGQYLVEVDDGTGLRGNYVDVTYMNCAGTQQTTRILNTQSRLLCMLQNAPDEPVLLTFSGDGASYEYVGLC